MRRSWLRALGWWAADYSYVLFWQARALFSTADAGALRAGDRRPVVIIPGIYEPWKFMAPLYRVLHEQGHPIYAVPALKLNLRPVTEAAGVVTAFLEANEIQDAIVVAHSKGGLIGKLVMVQDAGRQRVRGMVAVATPFSGSVYARYMVAPSLRIFSPDDPTLRSLGSEAGVNSRIVSIYGKFDPHIPARSGLDGARNVELETGGHFRILSDPSILEEVELLDRLP